MKQSLLILFAVLFLSSGCAFKSKTIDEYKLHLNVVTKPSSAQSCSSKRLKVAEAFSSNSLRTLQMNYVENSFHQYAYTQSQWAQEPNKAITDEVVKYLKSRKIFKSVQKFFSRSKADYLLEIDIEDFMQYFNENATKSYVHVVIDFSLIDLKTRELISTKTFDATLDAKPNAQGGVETLNKGLEKVLKESGEWLEEVCK